MTPSTIAPIHTHVAPLEQSAQGSVGVVHTPYPVVARLYGRRRPVTRCPERVPLGFVVLALASSARVSSVKSSSSDRRARISDARFSRVCGGVI